MRVLLLSLLLSLSQTQSTEIDALLASWKSEGAPGGVVLVMRGDEIVLERAYGLADVARGVPITASTRFPIASVSKHFTAYAVLALAAEGKLSLDDDVRKYVSEVPELGSTITIRHLLTHTSGIRDFWELQAMSGRRFEDSSTARDVLRLVSRQKRTNFPPGSEYAYSNTEYVLLAQVIERVTKMSFAEHMAETIFRPLGMSDTAVFSDRTRIEKNVAESYAPAPGGGFLHRTLQHEETGSAGIISTARDLAKWVQHLERQQSIAAVMEGGASLRDGKRIAEGTPFGVAVGEHRGHRTIGQSGGDAGYRAAITRFPDDDLTVIVLGNSVATNATSLTRRVAEIVVPLPAEQAATTIASRENAPASIPVKASLDDLAGRYYSSEIDTTWELVVSAGALRVTHIRNDDITLTAQAKDRFTGDVWWMRDVRFVRDTRGKVRSMLVTGFRGVRELEFARVR